MFSICHKLLLQLADHTSGGTETLKRQYQRSLFRRMAGAQAIVCPAVRSPRQSPLRPSSALPVNSTKLALHDEAVLLL